MVDGGPGVGSEGDAPVSVLLIEDDVALAEEVCQILTAYGLNAVAAHDWGTALDRIRDMNPDAIVLDQRLGRTDALTRIGEMRAATTAPILVLSGNRMEADRIVALELGADDYLTKPISGRELLARIRAHLRRAQPVAPRAQPGRRWRIASLERRLYRPDGEAVALTAAEFALLEVLAASPGRPIDRDTLMRQALRRPYRPEDRSIDNLVYQVRLKVSRAGGGEVVRAVRNQGYVFTGFAEDSEASAA